VGVRGDAPGGAVANGGSSAASGATAASSSTRLAFVKPRADLARVAQPPSS
jgi:hypothetical protein